MIDSQLVGNAVQWFAQQSVLVQRPNEVFHDVTLFFREVKEVHLFYQLVVERLRLSVDDVFALLLVRHAPLIDGQLLVVASQ